MRPLAWLLLMALGGVWPAGSAWAVAEPATAPDSPTRLVKWEVLARHGDAGLLAAEITPGYVEARQAGIACLRLTFSGPLDPASLGIGALSIRGQLGGDLSDMVAGMALQNGDTVLIVELSDALDDGDRYRLSLGDQVRAAAGGMRIVGNRTCDAGALVGDTDGSGRVDYGDVAALRIAAAAGHLQPRDDVDCDGSLGQGDEDAIMARSGRSLPPRPAPPAQPKTGN